MMEIGIEPISLNYETNILPNKLHHQKNNSLLICHVNIINKA